MNAFVNHENTKARPDGAYGKVINQIGQDGVCPFCPEYLSKYHKNPILREGQYWLLTKNMYPYDGTSHHLLLIHKEHIQHFNELSTQAWKELQTTIQQAINDLGIQGGTLLFRFGDTSFTGASVTHLHAQLVSGSGKKDSDAVLARVG